MRIAIDIDSTLHHYWDGFAAAARRRFGVELPYDEQFTWEIDRLRPEQVSELVRETHGDASVLAAEPYPGAVQTVRRWHAQGHFIHVTSHRATTAHGATDRWLREHGIAHDELYCSYDKISRCVEIAIDVLIDDSPVNLQAALDRGIVPATLVHPWNRELCDQEPAIIRARDWPELSAALDPLLAGVARDGRDGRAAQRKLQP